MPEFDSFAENYDDALAQGLSVTGEDKEFFACGRIDWLARCLHRYGTTPASILDYGCGTGASVLGLLQLPGVQRVVGVDVSPRSLAVARRLQRSPQAEFHLSHEFMENATLDVAFSNGVFHHIPVAARAEAVAFVSRTLRPGGLFAFWENNPWNPGTRWVMSRIPFDRVARTLSPPKALKLLRAGGFEVLRIDFRFYFPRLLAWFRPLENALVKLPFGAQYQVLCRKPIVCD